MDYYRVHYWDKYGNYIQPFTTVFISLIDLNFSGTTADTHCLY